MTEAQKLTIKPNGAVKSGDFSYSADTDSGRVDFSGQVVVGFFHITKSVPPGSFYVVDPGFLRSSKLQRIGDQVQIQNVTFTVMSVRPGQSTVSVVVAGSTPVQGTAIIDTSGEFIRVVQILAKVSVPIVGMLAIEADAVSGSARGFIARVKSVVDRFFDALERKLE